MVDRASTLERLAVLNVGDFTRRVLKAEARILRALGARKSNTERTMQSELGPSSKPTGETITPYVQPYIAGFRKGDTT
jgi:hypothetical protein